MLPYQNLSNISLTLCEQQRFLATLWLVAFNNVFHRASFLLLPKAYLCATVLPLQGCFVYAAM